LQGGASLPTWDRASVAGGRFGVGGQGVFMADDQRTVELKLDLAAREVLIAMGNTDGRPVRPDIVAMVSQLLAEAAGYMQVRGTYVVRNVVGMTPTQLDLERCPPFHGPIRGFLRPARRVGVFVVTVGETVERIARERHEAGLMAEAFILHAIGTAAADAACDALVEHLWAHETNGNEAVTAPFSPGFCGMPLQEQEKLFSVLDAESIGVTLLPTMMMRPLKSLSGLAGIGPASEVEAHGVPCEHCQVEQCGMRRRFR